MENHLSLFGGLNMITKGPHKRDAGGQSQKGVMHQPMNSGLLEAAKGKEAEPPQGLQKTQPFHHPLVAHWD